MSFCTTTLPSVKEQRQCQWPRGMILKWTVRDAVAPFSKSETKDVMRMAWSQWEAVCGIKTQFVSRGAANVTVLSSRIDGRNGVLAEAQLPCGHVNEQTQLWARFDTGEDWVVSDQLGQGMDLVRVSAHEFGHSLGLGHAPQGSRNLMAPTVSNIRTPQTWGINQSVMRYGQPNLTPVDPKLPDPTPPAECPEACRQLLSAVLTEQNLIGGGRTSLLETIRQVLALWPQIQSLWPQIQALLECISKLSPQELQGELQRLTARRGRLSKKKGKKK